MVHYTVLYLMYCAGPLAVRNLVDWPVCASSPRSLLGTELELDRMSGDSEPGSGSRLLEWWSSGRDEVLQPDSYKKVGSGTRPQVKVSALPVSGRSYDCWGIGLTYVRPVAQPLAPPYLRLTSLPCWVGHVGGPVVQRSDDVAVMSLCAISFFPPWEDLLEAPDEGAKDEVLCLAASSRADLTEQELGNCDVGRADPTEQELGNCDVARADPTEQELGNRDVARADPTEQELGNWDVARVDPTEQELGNRDVGRADPTEQELGNWDVGKDDPTEQELGNWDVARVDPSERELGNCDVGRADPTKQELGNWGGARVDSTEQELGNRDVVRVDPTEQELGNCDSDFRQG
ncbi:hypothetical protein GW17_00039463 [Ensete ventricosum]|nr:hypothetical protein GW17_00039463 [Ensete ventricosum]